MQDLIEKASNPEVPEISVVPWEAEDVDDVYTDILAHTFDPCQAAQSSANLRDIGRSIYFSDFLARVG